MSVRTFSCLYLDNVACTHPEREKFRSLDYRCFQCCRFKKWEKLMDEEDGRMMDEIEKIQKNPDAYLHGDIE